MIALVAQPEEHQDPNLEVACSSRAKRPNGGMTTVQKGELAFIKCALRALELGVLVSKPTIDARYDAILDVKGKLYKVQIKYCDRFSSRVNGAVELNLTRRGRRYTASEIDVLLVYIPSIEKILWLPASHFDKKCSIVLRYAAPANNQVRKIRLIAEFIW
jgi:hypothetical protein